MKQRKNQGSHNSGMESNDVAQHQRELTDRKRMRSVGSVRFHAIVLSNSGGRSDMTPICQVWSEIAATRERERDFDRSRFNYCFSIFEDWVHGYILTLATVGKNSKFLVM